jgi:hypothetical protein
MKQQLLRWTGASLALGGALTVLINAGFTPFLRPGQDFVQTVTSPLFLWRQSSSAVAAACLLFGSIGLYLADSERGRFGTFAFVAACLGSALLLETEWVQVFDIRDLAFTAPATLRALNARHGPTLSDAGALASLGLFTIGWIALAASTLRSRLLSRRGAVLVIAGFFAIPMLQPILGLWGAVIGDVVLGTGFILLGRSIRAAALRETT